MHHHGGPHARAQVGGAGGEVAQARVVCVRELGFQPGVYLGHGVPCLLELDAGEDVLQAQVVLLIEQDAGILVAGNEHGAAFRTCGQLPRDEVALHQQLLLLLVQFGKFRVIAALHGGELARLRGGKGQGVRALLARGPAGEGGSRQIPGQADAGGEHDVVLVFGFHHPLGGIVE